MSDITELLEKLPDEGPKSKRAFALFCAERVAHLAPDPRVAQCLAVVRRKVADPASVTAETLRDAAYYASASAAYYAYAYADASAAAASAASAASAYYAAASASASADASAADAAYDAASSAAYDAASSAYDADARQAQRDWLLGAIDE